MEIAMMLSKKYCDQGQCHELAQLDGLSFLNARYCPEECNYAQLLASAEF